MSQTERDKIAEQAMKFLGSDFCRYCQYCMPCANEPDWKFDFPSLMRLADYASIYGYTEWAKEQYTHKEYKATFCEECGACEPKCPFNLPIREKMKKTHEILS